MSKADIGLIGLAVMGQNLVLNMNDHGYNVVVYNRTYAKTETFLKGPAKGTDVTGAHSLQEFVDQLEKPRKMIIMIKAGAAVDKVIEELVPLLDEGDIIIDGGNSHFDDSIRRFKELEKKNLEEKQRKIKEEQERQNASLMRMRED